MNAIAEKSNTLRKDIIELVYRSAAGHVGGDLSVIDILNVLYNRVMNVSPDNAASPDRDRFVLSKAHCADAWKYAADLSDTDFRLRSEWRLRLNQIKGTIVHTLFWATEKWQRAAISRQ